ncbi:hypothetical protein LJPFL01_1332 [Lelliottia jeotgali]|nr:hypothetical protein LJPFL01_1332 [Lelliottia jeotgali]
MDNCFQPIQTATRQIPGFSQGHAHKKYLSLFFDDYQTHSA